MTGSNGVHYKMKNRKIIFILILIIVVCSATYISISGKENMRTIEEDKVQIKNEITLKSGEDLVDSEQFIFAESSGTSCTVSLYEKNDQWTQKASYPGIVGRNGVNQKSREGDYCTPFGLYSLGFAFGMESIDGLDVEYRVINSNCYWVDDPESEYYNQWLETDTPVWNSAEHLSDYENSYRYGIVINYNMDPVVPGAGSAIFLHCATGDYTAGCVAVPKENMLDILKWVDSSKSPLIFIV